MPVLARNLLESIKLLSAVTRLLADRCIAGITANREHMRSTVEHSIGVVTALNPYIGYANATAVAQEALSSGRSVYDLVLEKKLVSKEKLDEILQPV